MLLDIMACRWDLVTILPGAVFGPPLSSRKSGESVGMLQARAESARENGCNVCSRAVSQVCYSSVPPDVCHPEPKLMPPAHLPQKFIEGKNWPAVPPMGFGCVDVDDIASAHALAAFTPSASGRCAGQTALTPYHAATGLLHGFLSPCVPGKQVCCW